jgi:integrase/recombinase XerD
MISTLDFEAQLIKLPFSEGKRRITVESTGGSLELTLTSSSNPIFSIVDSHGTLVSSAHNWLSYLRRQVGLTYSLNTVEQYGRAISYLCRWIASSAPYPNLDVNGNIKVLSRHDVVNWLTAMKYNGASSEFTLHFRESCLKQFLDWLSTKEGGCLRDAENSPWGRDGSLAQVIPAPNAHSPKYISAETIIDVLNGLHSECERCMFHAQYDMGLRISELVGLKLGDIPNNEQYDPAFEFIPICVNGAKGRGGTLKQRITLISRAVLKRIKRYHNTPEYKLAPDWAIYDPKKPAFLTANQLQWGIRNASKQFKSAVRRSNSVDAMKTHWLRHGAAYSVLRSDMGKDYQDRMLMLQQMLGHSHLKTTEIYTQISPALLTALTKAGQELNRLGEAEHIRERTFLGPLQHKEKRGHRG